MPYTLAIFDFDGTLADSFPFFLGAFNTIADRHGFRRIDVANAGHLRHRSMRQLMEHVGLPAWKLPAASRSFIAMMKAHAHTISLFDGIADALRHLHARGITLAVVSSNSEHNVRAVLGPELAALVAQYECGMSVFGKASRIRAVLKRRGIATHEAIYIGDQGLDADAAEKAGVAFGAVHWGYATIDALRGHACATEFVIPAELKRIAA